MCHLLEAFLLLSRVSRVGSRVRQHIFITRFFVFPPLLFWRSRMLNRRFTGESRKNRIVAAWIALGFSKSLQFHDGYTLVIPRPRKLCRCGPSPGRAWNKCNKMRCLDLFTFLVQPCSWYFSNENLHLLYIFVMYIYCISDACMWCDVM